MAWTPPNDCYRRAGFQGAHAGKYGDSWQEVWDALMEESAHLPDDRNSDEYLIWRYNYRLAKQYKRDEQKEQGKLLVLHQVLIQILHLVQILHLIRHPILATTADGRRSRPNTNP